MLIYKRGKKLNVRVNEGEIRVHFQWSPILSKLSPLNPLIFWFLKIVIPFTYRNTCPVLWGFYRNTQHIPVLHKSLFYLGEKESGSSREIVLLKCSHVPTHSEVFTLKLIDRSGFSPSPFKWLEKQVTDKS